MMKRFRLVAVLCSSVGVWLAGGLPANARSIPTVQSPMQVTVDLTDSARAIYHVKMQIPVEPGPLTLVYPKWIPGSHAPTTLLQQMAGLVFKADGQQLPWRRDLVDLFAFHLTVPAGVRSLDVSMDMLGQGNMDPYLVDMPWNAVLLYPAGHPASEVSVQANVKLPQGWQLATSLDQSGHEGEVVHFAAVPLNVLVDSPVMAGAHYRKLPLAESPRVTLNLFADSAPLLDTLTEKQLAAYRKLPTQEYAMFGSHHYEHYDFLMSLSDHVGNGLEHHQSTEVGAGAEYYANDKRLLAGADLLTHEYTHSWNGKFRRPAGLATPDYQQPMKDDLLWVYEGLTQYVGGVMATRIGLWTQQDYRDQLAMVAAMLDHRTGRAWRNLQDTADAAPLRFASKRIWTNYERATGVDFYYEGVLLWLDVDTQIRALSHDKRSLNDFARLFYGIDNGGHGVVPYTFDDIVAALNKVQPYDWSGFLRHILDRTGHGAPLDGITRGGWQLVYTDKQSDFAQAASHRGKQQNIDLMYSIGLQLDGKGEIGDVLWNGPAFKAGVGVGMTIAAVNGTAFSPEVLSQAIKTAQKDQAPIRLLVKNQDWFVTYDVDHHEGLKYPHLVRTDGTPDYLGEITTALAVK